MNAKNTSAAPLKIPPIPNAPDPSPRSCSRVLSDEAPAAPIEPFGGMNGCRFEPFT